MADEQRGAGHSDVQIPTDELAFRWRGGRLSVNLTATVGERWRRKIERLRQPADLARWFVEAQLTEVMLPVSAQDLVRARQLREALYQMFTAVRTGDVPPVSDVARVDEWAVQAVPGPGLAVDQGRLRAVPVPADAAVLLTLVARDGVELVTGPQAERIRECARPDCALLFVDTSRANARQWCATQACGARSRMSAYRRRQAEANA